MDHAVVESNQTEVKEEEQMDFPQPLHCLREVKTPLFLTKTYEMVDDPMTNDVVSWSSGRNSFIVWDAHMLASDILPRYFKHDHFSSFIRQLNFYGFRKIGGDWEFAHEYFLAGQKHLLNYIKRKKYEEKLMKKKQQSQSHMQSQQENDVSFVELVQSEQTLKLHKLKNERKMLTHENSQLRKQLLAIEKKLNTLTKQHQTMSFLVRALGKPTFVQQIIRRTEHVKQIKSSKKKRTVSASTNEEDLRAIEEVKNELILEGSSNIEGDNVGNLEIAIDALSNELMVGLSGRNQYDDFGERLLEWNEHLEEVLDHEWDVSPTEESILAEQVMETKY